MMPYKLKSCRNTLNSFDGMTRKLGGIYIGLSTRQITKS